MLTIIRHQISEGLKDARFLFLAVFILVLFVINGFLFSAEYVDAVAGWQSTVQKASNLLDMQAHNLQMLSNFEQTMMKRPSHLAFIAGGDEDKIPNSITVNAFQYRDPQTLSKDNKMLPVLPALDWIFIVGTLMSLMTVFLSYDAICGEKKNGTLRLILTNPVSRLKVFFGKYLGLFIVTAATLLCGILVNLFILRLNGALPLDGRTIQAIFQAAAVSILFLSTYIFLGMVVSSLVARPSVSLVLLLVTWTVFTVVTPGLAWLVSEQMVTVPSAYEQQREMAASEQEIWDNKPEEAKTLTGDLFSNNYKWYAEAYVEIMAMRQLIRDDAVNSQIRQTELNQRIAAFSPAGLLDISLQKTSHTGIEGFKSFYRNARRYQDQLHSFTVEADKADTETRTPHLVCSQGNRSYPRIFSDKGVDISTVPRWYNLSDVDNGILSNNTHSSQFLIIVLENLFLAALGFAAFMRYDPR